LQGQQMFLQQQQQGPSTGGFGTESTPLQALQQYQQGQQQYFGGSDMGDHDMGIASPQPSASVTGSGSPATPVLFLRGSAAADQQQRQKQQRGGDRHAGTKFGGSTLPQQEQQQAGIVGAGATQQGGGAGQAQADQQQSQQAGQQGDGMGTIGDRGPPGCGLAGNVDVLTCKADWLYHRYVHTHSTWGTGHCVEQCRACSWWLAATMVSARFASTLVVIHFPKCNPIVCGVDLPVQGPVCSSPWLDIRAAGVRPIRHAGECSHAHLAWTMATRRIAVLLLPCRAAGSLHWHSMLAVCPIATAVIPTAFVASGSTWCLSWHMPLLRSPLL
jgi:hypothetical protein